MHVDNYTSEEERDERRIKLLHVVSRVAIFACALMYISYISNIRDNLAGHPVDPIPAIMGLVNGVLWTAYGWLKTHKDWPLIIADVPGVIFCGLTLITIYIH
ncbi:SemiSWEET family transporter [Eupransor demetentiae]|uniref:SemiSWEET family n=1 Tax=Eupransor demetentiae TaxID=3109584 RepID=A0ABM9N365_9LACO|nr:SemiSWEET family [Lactobacillaceae bacterium LMG 33000]